MGRRIQPQGLAADRFKVWQFAERLVVHGLLAVMGFDDLGSEFCLHSGMRG